MGWAGILYVALQRSLRAAAPLLGGSESKLARGVWARRNAHGVLARWGREERDPGRPGVWIHAPSVGEALQAEAVVGALRGRRPELQAALTYFSPSAESVAARLAVDVVASFPWDLPAPMSTALTALEPDAVVFTRTEVWPVLTAEAVGRGVPVALVAATVRPGAGRSSWLARGVLAPTWRRLSLVAAVSAADAERLRALGVPPEAVELTGDPRVDSALARVADVDAGAPDLAPLRADPRPRVVAGSIWPADEAVLLRGLAEARRRVSGLRAIVVPHEPSDRYVLGLGEALASAGWRWAPLSEVTAAASAEGLDAVVVDSVGRLPALYTVADVAYVGGGFGRAGLHSVLEPAAAGAPVLFGPRHESQPAAAELLACGAAAVVGTPEEMAGTLVRWLEDPAAGAAASESASAYIEAQRGAAERTAALLDALITPA